MIINGRQFYHLQVTYCEMTPLIIEIEEQNQGVGHYKIFFHHLQPVLYSQPSNNLLGMALWYFTEWFPREFYLQRQIILQ